MDEQPEPITPEEARRLNAECEGAPKYFTYPTYPPCSEEERKRYEEASEQIAPIIERHRRRRRRRR